MKLYLVRHGEAEGSEGRAVGQLDLPLSPRGIESVQALAATWSGLAPVRLYASDLTRATDSARILAPSLGVEPLIDDRLREVSFGDWEGRTWDDIYETDRERYDAWSERWWELAPPGGESFETLAQRARAWFQSLPPGPDLVAVAHGGSIRALLVDLLAIPRERAFEITLAPARVSAVEVGEGGGELLFLDQQGFSGPKGFPS